MGRGGCGYAVCRAVTIQLGNGPLNSVPIHG